jgi:hypothetical protein
MARTAFNFDRDVVEDAVGRIQQAVRHVDGLGGFLPADRIALSVLRQHVEELRTGLIILTSLADGLQHLHDAQVARARPASGSAAGAGALASAVRAARGRHRR